MAREPDAAQLDGGRGTRARSTLLALWMLASACDSAKAPEDAGAADDATAPDAAALDAGGAGPDAGSAHYLTQLQSAADYAALQGEGAELKYLAVAPGKMPAPPLDSACVFQDTARFAFHVEFLRTFSAYADLDYESYLALVLRRATRVWWGGGLKLFAGARHPLTQQRGVVAFTAYQDGGGDENLAPSEIQALFQQLGECAPYARDLLVFVPDGGAQVAHVRASASELAALGVPVLMPENLNDGLGAQVYSEGENYGYLRIVPRSLLLGDHGPRDVIVVQSAPNDLAIAAGLITEHPQSEHSHVNLRLREKGIPNASLPDIYDNALVGSLDGALVHVRANGETITLEPARIEDAEAFWRAHQPMLTAPSADLSVTAMLSFATLRADGARAYGTKAANLGELHALLPPTQRSDGFGIPLSAYVAFMMDQQLEPQVQALLADPALKDDAGLRRQRLKALRDAIKAAGMPAGFLDALRAIVLEVWGEPGLTLRLKFRSSTNAEDLDTLSGAGLYDSKSGCVADDLDADELGPSLCLTPEDRAAYEATLAAQRAELAQHPERSWLVDSITDLQEELSEEKSALSAIRKVWASLWTERAFEERAYYGIDHTLVYMGIAVNPSFTREQLDAVVVTNLPSAEGGPLYRVVTQTADIGVVEPLDPTATPETLVFHRGTANQPEGLSLLVPSSRAPGAVTLWPEAQLLELEQVLFVIQDHFASQVYPQLVPLALDLEVKLTHDQRVVVKQARPYRLSTP